MGSNFAINLVVLGVIVVFGIMILVTYGDGTTYTTLSAISSVVYQSPFTLQSEEGITSSTVTAPANVSLVFDRDDDYISTGFNVNDTFYNNNWTITLWVKPSSFTNVNEPYFFFGDAVGGDRFYLKQAMTPTNITIGLGSWNDQYNSILSLNEWQFFAVSVNGTTGNIYRNLDLLESQSSITLNYPNAELYVSRPGNFAWNGSIDEFRIYNRALSQDELSTLYQEGYS